MLVTAARATATARAVASSAGFAFAAMAARAVVALQGCSEEAEPVAAAGASVWRNC